MKLASESVRQSGFHEIRRLAPDFFANEKAEVYIQARGWAERAYDAAWALRDGEISGLRQAYIKLLNRHGGLVEAIHRLEAVPDCGCDLCKAVNEMKAAFGDTE